MKRRNDLGRTCLVIVHPDGRVEHTVQHVYCWLEQPRRYTIWRGRKHVEVQIRPDDFLLDLRNPVPAADLDETRV